MTIYIAQHLNINELTVHCSACNVSAHIPSPAPIERLVEINNQHLEICEKKK